MVSQSSSKRAGCLLGSGKTKGRFLSEEFVQQSRVLVGEGGTVALFEGEELVQVASMLEGLLGVPLGTSLHAI
jgi:hypothetical protein